MENKSITNTSNNLTKHQQHTSKNNILIQHQQLLTNSTLSQIHRVVNNIYLHAKYQQQFYIYTLPIIQILILNYSDITQVIRYQNLQHYIYEQFQYMQEYISIQIQRQRQRQEVQKHDKYKDEGYQQQYLMPKFYNNQGGEDIINKRNKKMKQLLKQRKIQQQQYRQKMKNRYWNNNNISLQTMLYNNLKKSGNKRSFMHNYSQFLRKSLFANIYPEIDVIVHRNKVMRTMELQSRIQDIYHPNYYQSGIYNTINNQQQSSLLSSSAYYENSFLQANKQQNIQQQFHHFRETQSQLGKYIIDFQASNNNNNNEQQQELTNKINTNINTNIINNQKQAENILNAQQQMDAFYGRSRRYCYQMISPVKNTINAQTRNNHQSINRHIKTSPTVNNFDFAKDAEQKIRLLQKVKQFYRKRESDRRNINENHYRIQARRQRDQLINRKIRVREKGQELLQKIKNAQYLYEEEKRNQSLHKKLFQD